MAPPTVGPDVFTFAVQGTSDGALQSITSGSPSVTVERQASGKAKSATATVSDNQGVLYAGQEDRQVTVVYTAAGQMVQGKVQLTVPAKAVTIEGLGWSAPTGDNVTVTPTSAYSTVEYGGSLATPTQMVTVEGVNLMAGGALTFVYTGKVQPGAGDATFAVKTDGGLRDHAVLADDAFAEVTAGEVTESVPEPVMLTLTGRRGENRFRRR